jgi:hypothetical protein
MDNRTAATIAAGILALAICMLAGDYFGYKIGRMKLFTILGVSSLAAIVIFAIIAGINSMTQR